MRTRKGHCRTHSFGWYIIQYRQSAEYKSLAANTRTIYERAFDHLHPLKHVELSALRRRHIKRIRDALMDKPALANQVVRTAHMIMARAVDDELLSGNPLSGLKQFTIGEHAPWRPDQIDHASKHLSEGYRRAMVLGLHTGQRLGDVVRMRWSDYDGDTIHVIQGKTGTELFLPVSPELKAELDIWVQDRKALTILANAKGQPYKERQFTATFSRALRRHAHMAGCTFHGLRVTCAIDLAMSGCTTHEIAAITGHTSLQMVQHYSKKADQLRRARAAMAKRRGGRAELDAEVVGIKRP